MTDATKSVVLDRELEEEKNQDSSGSCIRCPLCGWSPRKEGKWFCCGSSKLDRPEVIDFSGT